jgi:hypothetical protein
MIHSQIHAKQDMQYICWQIFKYIIRVPYVISGFQAIHPKNSDATWSIRYCLNYWILGVYSDLEIRFPSPIILLELFKENRSICL